MLVSPSSAGAPICPLFAVAVTSALIRHKYAKSSEAFVLLRVIVHWKQCEALVHDVNAAAEGFPSSAFLDYPFRRSCP